ncbi:uncharacterized protein Dmoj_GI27081, isoform A [Drosophila mojavensis]|uniref:Uncharacterized protein, isoform A n=1 Tax=Drosophila mojavensis TaxID=7230 RepID=A0A0Q9X5P7_DROMO|nr:uncharacterized protein Dmoj_GI27081, isoform A [Drosophila mojavensis]
METATRASRDKLQISVERPYRIAKEEQHNNRTAVERSKLSNSETDTQTDIIKVRRGHKKLNAQVSSHKIAAIISLASKVQV